MPESNEKEKLLTKIRNADALVGIIGLGYVGLPLSLAFADKGFRVLGFDIDPEKIKMLNRGECYIAHLGQERVRSVFTSGRLQATTDFTRLDKPDAIIICVPTPLTPQRDPDMTFIKASAEQISSRLRPGQLVVLESTTYPGTTDELLRTILEKSGLVCGRVSFLAFSPEREDPGNPRFFTANTPKVVGGVDRDGGDLAQALYDQVIQKTVRVSNARVAEAAKLTENIFRAVNIALVNELKVVYELMGIDIWEVLDAASTKPFGFMRFEPGPGWGGHCIPLDPFYLSWKAREHGIDTKFIELAGEINRGMPQYVIDRLQQAFNRRAISIKGSKILVMGIAYKKGVGDTRESPAIQIIPRLLELGAEVTYHDPYIPSMPRTRHWPAPLALNSQTITPEFIAAQDAILIITDHASVDYEMIAKHARLIVDSRGVYRKLMPNVVKA